ncbi:MAG: hypothetical protein ACRDMV_09985 [Streptosporangiales bacterium]
MTPFGIDPAALITVTIYPIMGWEVFRAGLWLLWGLKVRQGRNWARVLTTIFAVFGILDFLSSWRHQQRRIR